MSVFSRKDWQDNFPFTRSILRDVPGQTATPRGIGVLAGAGINEGGILDGHSQIPATTLTGIDPVPVSTREAAGRDAIRLLPLEGFVWGGASLQPRTRSEHALIWVTDGRLRLDLPRQPGIMQAGDLRWIPAGTAFAATPLQAASGHVLLIRPEQMRDLAPRYQIAASTGRHGPQMLTVLRNLELAARQGAALTRQLDLLMRVIGEMAPSHPVSAPDLTRSSGAGLVERFEGLAQGTFGPTVTVADLARMLGCGTAALDRAALDHRGKRAVDILNDIRLRQAITLLRETRLSVTQIAADTGFASHAHFARVLCAATGRRPETFRNQPG